jgi:hypothetical protein
MRVEKGALEGVWKRFGARLVTKVTVYLNMVLGGFSHQPAPANVQSCRLSSAFVWGAGKAADE